MRLAAELAEENETLPKEKRWVRGSREPETLRRQITRLLSKRWDIFS